MRLDHPRRTWHGLVMPARALIALCLLFGGCSLGREAGETLEARRANEWIVTERVTFADTSGPDVIKLSDGTRLNVLYENRSTWEEVGSWTKETRLTYGYGTVFGAVLIQPESRTRLVVYDGFENKHPLDLLLSRNLAAGPTNMDMLEAYDSSVARWTAEIDRIYLFLSERADVPPEAKKALMAEQRAWKSFIEAHGKASSELYRLPDGTMWGMKDIEAHHELIRGHALRLLKLVEPLSAASIQKW